MSCRPTIRADVNQQIRRRMDAWKTAFESKDVDEIMTFYVPGDEFSAFDLMPPLEFRGGAMWRDAWTTFFAAWQGSPTIDMTDVQIHAGEDLAVFRALAQVRGTMAGHEADLWTRQTICLRRVDGEWLMIHNHISVPLDFATGQALLTLSPERLTPTGTTAA